MHEYPYRTCAEIDLNKLQRNLQRLRALIGPDCRIMEVMKADAYGHGLRVCAEYAAPYVDWFAAATLEEALAVRAAAPHTPILIFGGLLDPEIIQAAQHGLTINVFSLQYASHVQALLQPMGLHADVHIKVDTGMNRLGLHARPGHCAQAVSDAAQICALDRLHVTGIYTHFACADSTDPSDSAFTDAQFAAFQEVCSGLEALGIDPGLRHCASTGGLLVHPEYRSQMVRAGMFALGMSYSAESARACALEPILTWYAKVVDIRTVEPGESVSYGRIFTAERPTRVAVLSVGYADGYSRAFSNRARVLLHGKYAPVRGKTCMDFTMVDVTDIPDVAVGDQAVLLGADGGQCIPADELAALLPDGTNGGVTADIHFRVRRVYRYDNATVAVSDVRY